MKFYQKLLPVITLALLLPIIGCSNDDDLNVSEITDTISPIVDVETAPDVKTFFSTVSPRCFFPGMGYQIPEMGYEDLDFFDNECLVINSASELSSHYIGEAPLPKIDFDQYTLIVGWVYVWDSNVGVKNPTIEDHGKYYTLKLPIVIYPGFSLCQCMNAYYWGLFPKLSDKKIKTEIIKPNGCNF